jgi:hypothetical protein
MLHGATSLRETLQDRGFGFGVIRRGGTKCTAVRGARWLPEISIFYASVTSIGDSVGNLRYAESDSIPNGEQLPLVLKS